MKALIPILTAFCLASVQAQETPTPKEFADVIVEALENCPKAHTLVLVFPNNEIAALAMPPYPAMIANAKAKGEPNPKQALHAYIATVFTVALKNRLVSFNLVHTEDLLQPEGEGAIADAK